MALTKNKKHSTIMKNNNRKQQQQQQKTHRLVIGSLLITLTFIIPSLLVENQTLRSYTNYISQNIRHSQSKILTKSDLVLIWLVHYPQTGAFYTRRIVQRITGTTMATNDGRTLTIPKPPNHPIPVYPSALHTTTTTDGGSSSSSSNANGGPYRTSLLPLPPKYILTETQCAAAASSTTTTNIGSSSRRGFLPHTHPSLYVPLFTSPILFAERCRTSIHRSPRPSTKNEIISLTYPATTVGKIIFLVRDPFDVVVSRFKAERRSRRDNNGNGGDSFLSRHPDDVEGFQSYCRSVDEDEDLTTSERAFWTHYHFNDDDIVAAARDVPCRAEFYRYVSFLNAAFVMGRSMGVPTMILRYEDYKEDGKLAVDRLLKFLELKRRQSFWRRWGGMGAKFRFKGGYVTKYFSVRQMEKAKLFIRFLASDEVEAVLSQYFPGVLPF